MIRARGFLPPPTDSFRPVRTCTRYFHWKKQNLFPSLFDLSSTHSSGAKVNGEEKKRKNKRKKEREKKEGRGISFFCEHVLEQRNQYSSVSCLPSSSIDRDENRGWYRSWSCRLRNWTKRERERERERNSFYFYVYFIIDNLFLHNFFNFSLFLSWIKNWKDGWIKKRKKTKKRSFFPLIDTRINRDRWVN